MPTSELPQSHETVDAWRGVREPERFFFFFFGGGELVGFVYDVFVFAWFVFPTRKGLDDINSKSVCFLETDGLRLHGWKILGVRKKKPRRPFAPAVTVQTRNPLILMTYGILTAVALLRCFLAYGHASHPK